MFDAGFRLIMCFCASGSVDEPRCFSEKGPCCLPAAALSDADVQGEGGRKVGTEMVMTWLGTGDIYKMSAVF